MGMMMGGQWVDGFVDLGMDMFVLCASCDVYTDDDNDAARRVWGRRAVCVCLYGWRRTKIINYVCL